MIEKKPDASKILFWVLSVMFFDVLTYNVHVLFNNNHEWVVYYAGRFTSVFAYLLLPLVLKNKKGLALLFAGEMFCIMTLFMGYWIDVLDRDSTDDLIAVCSLLNIFFTWHYLKDQSFALKMILRFWGPISGANLLDEIFLDNIVGYLPELIGFCLGTIMFALQWQKEKKKSQKREKIPLSLYSVK